MRCKSDAADLQTCCQKTDFLVLRGQTDFRWWCTVTMLSFPSWAGFAGVFQTSGVSPYSRMNSPSSLRLWLLIVPGCPPAPWPDRLYRLLWLISSQNRDGDFSWALHSCRTEFMGLLRDRLDDGTPHVTHHAASHDIFSKLCEAWGGGSFWAVGAVGWGPLCQCYTAHSSFKQWIPLTNWKKKDKESICIRTSSTIPGKQQ